VEQNNNRFNKGTRFGYDLIKHSLQELGCGRSILADKNGTIISGNDVYKAAKELGKRILTIETDGDTLIIVKRTDVDADETKGLELALVDNLAQEKNLDWDADTLCLAMQKRLSFDPRKWGGHECLVKELKIEDLFKDDVVPKVKKSGNKEFVSNEQLSLFE